MVSYFIYIYKHISSEEDENNLCLDLGPKNVGQGCFGCPYPQMLNVNDSNLFRTKMILRNYPISFVGNYPILHFL